MKEKRLCELSKRIFRIIKEEPFTAESYSKVYTDIVLSFVDLKLDSMLSHFKIDPNIEQNEKIISYISTLNKSLNFENNRVFELFFLIPQLESTLEWRDFKRIYDITDILRNLESKYGIIVEESQLEEHWKARHNIELPDNILTKLLNLCSHYLKINKLKNIEDVHSLLLQRDLPFSYIIDAHFKVKVLISNIENMTWERLIFIHELKAITELIPTQLNIKMQEFIHSIYKFENKDVEIDNLLQYNIDNDIWKLSRINNFEFIDNSTKETFYVSKYKLLLLETIKKQPNLLNDYIIRPVISNIEFLSGEKYVDSVLELIKLQSKIRQCYDSWIYNHKVADWDNYWIKMENEHGKNELNKAQHIVYSQVEENMELKEKLKMQIPKTSFIPEFADIKDLKWKDITIVLFYEQNGECNIKFKTNSDSSGKLSLIDTEFIDKRTGKTNLDWACLQDLAENRWNRIKNLAKFNESFSNVVDKRMSCLNKHLKQLTGLKTKCYTKPKDEFPKLNFAIEIKDM